MEEFNEIVEFLMAHKMADYPGHKIMDSAMEEFSHLMEKPTEEYFGIQLDGKDKIHVTYMNMENKLRMGALIQLS